MRLIELNFGIKNGSLDVVKGGGGLNLPGLLNFSKHYVIFEERDLVTSFLQIEKQ